MAWKNLKGRRNRFFLQRLFVQRVAQPSELNDLLFIMFFFSIPQYSISTKLI